MYQGIGPVFLKSATNFLKLFLNGLDFFLDLYYTEENKPPVNLDLQNKHWQKRVLHQKYLFLLGMITSR